ncbi:GNAT family N-acetyltransferase [soil metagenome]
MPGPIVRPIAPEELPRFVHAMELAFHDRPTEEGVERERLIAEPERFFVALDGDDFVGTAGACSTRLTVPGPRSLPAAGITAVGVRASHRRRGINTALMGALLGQAAERGEPLVYLWASESAIYGRFGYGIASFCAELELPTRHGTFVEGTELSGNMRLAPRDEALPQMRPVYERVAASRPGMIAMEDRWWKRLFDERKRDEDKPTFFALHEDEGVVDGYAVYQVKHEWAHSVSHNEVEVQHLIAATPSATASLWRFLRDIDLVATVKAWDRPGDEELLWLTAEPRRMKMIVSDGLWVRIVDVNRSLEGRGYASDGTLVVDVADRFRPETAARYQLVVRDGSGSCARTDAEPDLSCGIDALGAVYLGGVSFRQLARVQQMREHTPGSLARADAMFASDPSPWFGFIY